MSNVFFIEERVYPKEQVPKDFITKQYFSPYEDSYKLKVTGLSINNLGTYFFLPKNTTTILSDTTKISLGKMTFESLVKYRNENRLKSEEESWLGKKNSNVEMFDLVNWLIEDYKKHGIYVEEEVYKSNNSTGAINWNRTIKNTQPFIIDEQIIYPNLITYSKRTNHYSILAAIHNNIILTITQKYGWLFNVSKRKNYIDIHLNREQKILYLKRELNQTTNTRTQNLIIKILSFLIKADSENQSFDMVTPYFQNVWEDAIKKVFGHDPELQKSVAKPYWKFKDGEIKESNQFPDVLISQGNKLIIIDAKYYSLGETMNSNLPGWSSIVKQLYYSLSINKQYESLSNLFLIPEFSEEDKKIDYIGYTSVLEYEKEFGLVYAFRLNSKLLLHNYLINNERSDLLSLLLSKIEKIKYKANEEKTIYIRKPENFLRLDHHYNSLI